MKGKIIFAVLALALSIGLVACGNAGDEIETPPVNQDENIEMDESVQSESTLTVLDNIWAAYDEADLFAVIGGSLDAAVDNAPGAFSLADADGLTYQLYVPEADADKLLEAASMMHMMNANTFTCGAFKLPASDVDDFISDYVAGIYETQWICGTPEKLMVIKVYDDTIVCAFGETSIMETFKDNLLSIYSNADIVCEEDIVLGADF